MGDETLKAIFEMGKLGLTDEEIGEEPQCIIAGTGKVKFDTAIQTAKNAGNGEESLGSAKTCSSVISEDKKRRREERKNKENKRANKTTHIEVTSKTTNSNATSSLTSQSINADSVKKRMEEDPKFAQMIIAISTSINSDNSRAMEL